MQRVDRTALQFEVVSEEVAVFLRQKTGAERLEIASRMYSSARCMLMYHLQSIHPDWDDQKVEQEAARRLSHGAV
jgi:hypothetical protein